MSRHSGFRTAKRNPRLALGAHLMDTYVFRRWTPPDQQPWDVLPALYDSGIEWVRVGVTTQSFRELRGTDAWHTLPWRSEYWSCLEVSGALDIEVFEIGNETDFGIRGIRLGTTVPTPPGVDPVNDPAWMRDNIWVRGSKYFRR